ncbi:hypothetical protein BGY98DRAFT_933241 [Russula aff. rugulosa BPL654]|nr:hypothetical protein BGY98DRAFT_933241 [Russula aff. rugulosa BPL654]
MKALEMTRFRPGDVLPRPFSKTVEEIDTALHTKIVKKMGPIDDDYRSTLSGLAASQDLNALDNDNYLCISEHDPLILVENYLSPNSPGTRPQCAFAPNEGHELLPPFSPLRRSGTEAARIPATWLTSVSNLVGSWLVHSIDDARSAQRAAATKTPPVATTSAPQTAPEAVVVGGVTNYPLSHNQRLGSYLHYYGSR